MSWVVGQRTNEFGVRMALGARARDIIRMLLGQSLRPILAGLLLGTLGGYGLSRALNAMFFRMTGAEPMVYVAIATLMLAVALAAAWVPARRVTRIDPQQALRCE
jgi:ABC-type antimicrobial peptide transport system permease subunit